MKNFLLLLLSVVLISVGCYKDVDDTPPTQVIVEIEEVFVNTSISGAVLDLDGSPISSYNLIVNDELNIISSDLFFIHLDDVKKKGQTIHVFKDNKQIGIKTHLLVENDINHLEIQQHREFDHAIINSTNNTIELSKYLKLDFSNTKWEGGNLEQVNVEYTHIFADNSLTPVGYTELSDVVSLDSKGGIYIRVKNDEDESILATAENPIILHTDQLNDDINSIFKFDEDEEIWVLVQDFARGDEIELLGEGYYTFARYSPGVFVEGKVTNDGGAVSYQPLQWNLGPLSNTFCATENGRWIALLPENENIDINLLNPCDESLQTEVLEVDVEDLAGQNLEIENSLNYQSLNVSVLDCEGIMISHPNFTLNSNDMENRYVFSSEYQDRYIAVCDEFSISAFNNTTGLSGTELNWSTDLDESFEVLTDCNEMDMGYTYIKIRDDEEFFPAFELIEDGNKTILQSQSEDIQFIFDGQEARLYAENEVNVYIDDNDFGGKGYFIKCENSEVGCGITHFNVTHFETGGINGGMIRVTFSGKMWMQSINPSLAGEFEVEGVIVIKR